MACLGVSEGLGSSVTAEQQDTGIAENQEESTSHAQGDSFLTYIFLTQESQSFCFFTSLHENNPLHLILNNCDRFIGLRSSIGLLHLR